MNLSSVRIEDVMSLMECVNKISDEEFAKVMNPPTNYEPTEEEVELLITLKAITEKGNSAEVKRSKYGRFVVYEVTKKKAV